MTNKPLRRHSIQLKLISIFVIVCGVLFAVNIYIYADLNKTIKKIDSVYSNNILLNNLSDRLDDVQNNLYQYLKRKESPLMEEFYVSQTAYENVVAELNHTTVGDESLVMEKNIVGMSDTYINYVESALRYKRGNNVDLYSAEYEKVVNMYNYIKSNVDSLNTVVFKQNSGDYKILRQSLDYTIMLSAVFLVLTVILAFAWVILVTRGITKPLVTLSKTADAVANGDMNIDLPIISSNDEVGTLSLAFNKMLVSIRSYIEETKENLLREGKMKENELIMKNDLKEAELKYLQAQINPHFLFNTLNAGAQLSMMEGAEKTYVFIENMADFFRYNVRKIDKDTTIKEELEITDNYIYIMNVRFSGQFSYEKTIDNRLVNFSMPSMILQPLVENSINHGIREMEEGGKICVKLYSENDSIMLVVSDNGKGITDDEIEKIMEGKEQEDNSKNSSGIGLQNVISRLRGYYGSDDVFTIRQGSVGGTESVIKIPMNLEK
ncbi:MAG: histidine kinase [Lachnospiraceae bacterium]|jgi:sensor histidine kinase YesM|nr:histidine kinase [Lachnospiraceae bacterium]